ncbi:MAG: hypothetical protein ABI627_14565 [Polyangiaceae bacterium]
MVILLHGLGAEAESMQCFITPGRFETLADLESSYQGCELLSADQGMLG